MGRGERREKTFARELCPVTQLELGLLDVLILCVPQEVRTICSHSWPFLVLSGKESFLMIENSKLVVVQCPPRE